MSTGGSPLTAHRSPLGLAVLVSGGLDSAVLLAEAVRVYPAVHPLYVRVGSFWEGAEESHLRRFLAAVAGPADRSASAMALTFAPHAWLAGRRDVDVL